MWCNSCSSWGVCMQWRSTIICNILITRNFRGMRSCPNQDLTSSVILWSIPQSLASAAFEHSIRCWRISLSTVPVCSPMVTLFCYVLLVHPITYQMAWLGTVTSNRGLKVKLMDTHEYYASKNVEDDWYRQIGSKGRQMLIEALHLFKKHRLL